MKKNSIKNGDKMRGEVQIVSIVFIFSVKGVPLIQLDLQLLLNKYFIAEKYFTSSVKMN